MTSNATNKYARKDYTCRNTLMVAVLVRRSLVSIYALTPAPYATCLDVYEQFDKTYVARLE